MAQDIGGLDRDAGGALGSGELRELEPREPAHAGIGQRRPHDTDLGAGKEEGRETRKRREQRRRPLQRRRCSLQWEEHF